MACGRLLKLRGIDLTDGPAAKESRSKPVPPGGVVPDPVRAPNAN
jgi:hypothetical protein